MSTPPPIHIEDSKMGPGLCCACGKNGMLGRCPSCGLLMHHARVAPILPGRPQPCPRCGPEVTAADEKRADDMFPHEPQVEAQAKRYRPTVGSMKPMAHRPAFPSWDSRRTDTEAVDQGFRNAEGPYCHALGAMPGGEACVRSKFRSLPPHTG